VAAEAAATHDTSFGPGTPGGDPSHRLNKYVKTMKEGTKDDGW
jgi:hypothetical protein